MTPQLYALKASAHTFLMRHHPAIFTISMLLLLITAVFSLYLITTMSAPATTPTDVTATGFNQKTVDQIKNLHDSADRADKLIFPSPRSNPFVEK